MNSAKVAGVMAFPPEHSNLPELQSPVAQVKIEVCGSWEHKVRPQSLPAQVEGIEMDLDSDCCKEKPVEVSIGMPALDMKPGQTVYVQLFVNVNVVEEVGVERKLL